MMQQARNFRFARSEYGAVAIEFILVFPVLLIMAFGLIDATAFISDVRKMSFSANVIADTVTRLDTPTTPAAVDDAFEAAKIVMRDSQSTDVAFVIRTYWKDPADNVIKPRWSRASGTGAVCGVNTTGLSGLMQQGNDMVIAVVCGKHVPLVFRALGYTDLGLGSTVFDLKEQIALRPRENLSLECRACGNLPVSP